MVERDTLIARGPSLVRWGAVFSGAISAIALFALFGALWTAAAFNTVGGEQTVRMEGIANNLEWFLAGSAVVAMLIGGFVTGWFAELRGAGVGALNAFIAWAVTVFGAVVLGAPSVLGTLGITGGTDTFGFGALWAPFWGLLVGLLVAAIGGALGGTAPRPSWLFQPQAVELTELVSEPEGRTMHVRTIDLRREPVGRAAVPR